MTNTRQQLTEASERLRQNIVMSQWNHRKNKRDLIQSCNKLIVLCDKTLEKIRRDKNERN